MICLSELNYRCSLSSELTKITRTCANLFCTLLQRQEE
ncbi:hypothetical protein BRADI_4g01882v3 [Brachypodium distachyon]|uniref:Uncharacterized protein n=1 Tax=Brachypodium distachyon TaxID=15368 RepID=A0A2K2CJY8_BRADI|nr:hypothetical protein BRADI_4g01882v3 [Brachypodium distachyon]